MRLPFDLTLNALLMILIGVVCLIAGIYAATLPGLRTLAVGLVLTAVGNFLFGFTDGFSDSSPRGRMLFKIGVISYLGGIPIIVYSVYPMLR